MGISPFVKQSKHIFVQFIIPLIKSTNGFHRLIIHKKGTFVLFLNTAPTDHMQISTLHAA